MPRTPPLHNSSVRRALNGKGVVRAIYAVTGVVDEVNDLIVPGSFARTLATRRVKAAWHHDWKEPVGTVLDIEEWKPGDPRFATIPGGSVWPVAAGALVATVQYNMRTSRGRDAYEQVKQWHENGEAQFSIGYKVVAGGASKRHDGVRVIHDLDLYEISPVLHGAHPMTRSLELKAAVPAGRDELEHKATWSTVELKAAEAQAGRGVMVALLLPPDVAASVAHPEGTAAAQLHITLAYLGDAAALGGSRDDLRDIVAPAVSGSAALKGSIGGIGRFPDTGDGEPTWIPVDVPGLADLRQRIVDALGTSAYAEKLNTQHGFTPHVTLGYNLPDLPPVPATPVTFAQVAIVRGPDTSFVPLGQQPGPAGTPIPMEAKSAAQVVLEAKSYGTPRHSASGIHPAVRTAERKSATQIVLEAKFAPYPEAPMPPMPLSYEQLHARLAEAARSLLLEDGPECWVAIEATYPDRVLVTRHVPNGSATYAIPYTAAGRDVDLGTPTEVELTTVALPVNGETHAVDGDEELTARYMQPTAAALQDATALIEVSDAGPAHLQHLKPTITELLTTLAKKGLPMNKRTAPTGSSLDLWDSNYEVTDGWDDDPDEMGDTEKAGDIPAEPTDTGDSSAPAAPAPSSDEGAPSDQEPEADQEAPLPPDQDPSDRAGYSAPHGQNSEPEEEDQDDEQVRLNADEVKAMLASLTL